MSEMFKHLEQSEQAMRFCAGYDLPDGLTLADVVGVLETVVRDADAYFGVVKKRGCPWASVQRDAKMILSQLQSVEDD